MSEFGDLLVLWREVYGVNRKSAASKLGISYAQYWRIESGQAPMSMARLRKLGEGSDLSLNMLIIAFMVMDDNVKKCGPNDFGDRLIRWLHARLQRDGRRNESDSAARQLLGRPQSLEAAIEELTFAEFAPADRRRITTPPAPAS